MEKADLIVDAASVVTVDPDNRVLEHHSLAIRDGRIIEILPTEAHPERYEATEICDRSQHIVMPGLINAHTHLPMNLMRGLADDLPLMTWLEEHIWPTESRWLDADFVAAGARLALAESVRGGVTCINDMYFFPDTVAEQCIAAGVRCHIGMIVLDFPSDWARDAEHYIQRGLELHDRLRDQALVKTTFAPHSPYTVSQPVLEKIAMLSTELDVSVHMHIHETAVEVEQFQQQHGCRPLQRIKETGLLNPSLQAVHMTQLKPDEIAQLADTGVHVLHCPESNMKLASGTCPVTELLEQGVNVALGTDGAASNNDLDMFGETRTAALLAKHASGNAASVPASTALRMATINGAKALGIANETGSLEPGKQADMIAVSQAHFGMTPMFDCNSQLVYATDRHNVDDVWVAGKQIMRERKLLTLNQQQIMQESGEWATRLKSATTASA